MAKLASVTVQALGLQGRSDLGEVIIRTGCKLSAGFIRGGDIVVRAEATVGDAQIDPEAYEGCRLSGQFLFLRWHRGLLRVSDHPVEQAALAVAGNDCRTVFPTL